MKYFILLGCDRSLPLRFKKSKEDILIFRHYNRDGIIDPY
jgi:hypothetical protein